MSRSSKGLSRVFLISCLCNVPLVVACNRAPAEPESIRDPSPARAPAEPSSPSKESVSPEAPPAEPEAPPEAACVVPLPPTPPPQAVSIENCPQDPEGRPSMPLGKVRFPEAPEAPELSVELAQIGPHRSHGLMYRPTLSDEEGMLFTWNDERPRSFWMKNTCLALDMLFIARDLTIAGVLEEVPPMNITPRTVPCPATHVLEVPAGWVRKHGVAPGQKIALD